MSEIVATIAALQAAGWQVSAPSARDGAAPAATSVVDAWTASFSRLTNADDTVWFLSDEDYAAAPDDGFAWNEFETMSLQEAASVEEQERITSFWSRHRPILLSVRGHYAYLALRDDGRIVAGDEPEFEETRVVAEGLEPLLQMIAQRSLPEHGLLARMLFED